MTDAPTGEFRRLHEDPAIDYYPRWIVDRVLSDIALRVAPLVEDEKPSHYPPRQSVTEYTAFSIVEQEILRLSPEEFQEIEKVVNEDDLIAIDSAITVLSRVPNQNELVTELKRTRGKLTEHLGIDQETAEIVN